MQCAHGFHIAEAKGFEESLEKCTKKPLENARDGILVARLAATQVGSS